MVASDNPTPAHLRAARALLGWSQADLAAASGVSLRTIKAVELSPDLQPIRGRAATIECLVGALSGSGVTMSRKGRVIGVSLSLPAGA
ncbi:helix-turn-helix domain-containing protein [Pararoseomonas indoligenes]|uniref:Helix-turn-helix domain-containing protein n=1 Tax=Roseomonas indoligenes TaxID=2820811 RepID=A0A940N6J0_9PROT|nr:helix-turn-helix domain-containing protein [Pararoseomonas indoligenes]MBP0495037.1 helix-turn-helix domain-containing protein [Pararoseomonas indoligenes]